MPRERLHSRTATSALPAPTGVRELSAPPVLAVLLMLACALVSVSFRIYEYDVWQHLAYGRELWRAGIPHTQLWTWPDHGTPNANPSWGFSALLWLFWGAGGEWGLAAWRWLTTLAVFALLWRAARAMGVRGAIALPVFVIAALVYRQRSQVRPETLAAVFLALELWLLARRRGPSRADAALVGVAWGWANAHVSWYLGLVVLGAHALAGTWRPGDASRRGLWPVLAASLAVSFANPFGWRTVWRPFEFALTWRADALLSGISELQPLDWSVNLWNGLPLLLAGWPVLALWRSRRQGFDSAEWLLLAVGSALVLAGNRFAATYAVLAAPFVARALDAWWRSRAWSRGGAHTLRDTAIALVIMLVLPLREWRHYENAFGITPDTRRLPVAACDFMQRHEVRGRGFNDFFLGGYLLWRFHPETARLPYLDIHPEEHPAAMRRAYHAAFTQPDGWTALDAAARPDWVLLSRHHLERTSLLDVLDADPGWALVFVDDAAALYVARNGRAAAVAETFGYRLLSGGRLGLRRAADALLADPRLAGALAAEVARQQQESPRTAGFAMMRELSAAAGAGAPAVVR